jgi:hypothetical protein
VVGERSPEEIVAGSATARNYLGAPSTNLVYGTILDRFGAPERRLFPGLVATALALAGLGFGLAGWRSAGARVAAAYGLGLLLAFDVSLGFNGFTYRVMYEYALPFRALRIPARMSIFTGFSLAVLAGLGVASLSHRLRGVGRLVVPIMLAALLFTEYASKPAEMTILPLTPLPAYADIMRDEADGPTATLFEFPISPKDDLIYMYYSTFHWQRLVNGYSGFFPPSYIAAVGAVANFPDEESINTIMAHKTRYLVVHGERLRGARYATLIPELDRQPKLALVSRSPSERPGQHGEISVYRVVYNPGPR